MTLSSYTLQLNTQALTQIGLNLQAVINLTALPLPLQKSLQASSKNYHQYNQLLLLANGGKTFWQYFKRYQQQHSDIFNSSDPIDDYCKLKSRQFIGQLLAKDCYELIYPFSKKSNFEQVIDLQALGKMVGWHHSTPFRLGINHKWGSWFAYRTVILMKSNFEITEIVETNVVETNTAETKHPCLPCEKMPCVQNCPAKALSLNQLDLKKCLSYRLLDKSICKDKCVARLACPVANKQQYSLEQIQYHYLNSLRVIKELK